MTEEAHRGFGEMLRKAREEAGVQISDLAATTRIGSRFIVALEAEEWDRVPGSVIGRGFVRALARELHQAPGPLEAAYRQARGEAEGAPDHSVPEAEWKASLRFKRRRRWLVWGGGVGVLLLLLAAGIWFSLSRQGFDGAHVAEEPAPVGQAGQVEPLPNVPSPHRLGVQATEKVWVRVEVDGGKAQELWLEPGTAIEFGCEQGLRVTLGDAGRVQLAWNGVALRAPGAAGEEKVLEFPAAAAALQP